VLKSKKFAIVFFLILACTHFNKHHRGFGATTVSLFHFFPERSSYWKSQSKKRRLVHVQQGEWVLGRRRFWWNRGGCDAI